MISRIQKFVSPWLERVILASGRLRVDDKRTWRSCKRIIFVCTGNICRSPYAEEAARVYGMETLSCGIATRTGLPADTTAIEQALRRGRSLRHHRTQRWEDIELKPGDIVVAMQLRHARAVLPKARKAGCSVVMFSSLLPRFRPIWDPYGRSGDDFQGVFELIDSGVRRLAQRLQTAESYDHYHPELLRRPHRRVPVAAGRLAKELIGRILVALRLHRRLLRGSAIVVAFHSITQETSSGALRASAKDFDIFCRFFARHMRVVSLTRIVDTLEKNESLEGQLSITFDDGYADNAETAMPILARHGLQATFFVSTGFMDSGIQAQWDKMASIRSRWMSWVQIRQLIDAGHEVGAHTVSHADLRVMTGEEAEDEIRRSRDDLALHTGKVPEHFALPFGRYFPGIEATVQIARKLGFRSFSLCRGGVIHAASSPLHIERWPISPTDYISPFGWIVDVLREARTNKEIPVSYGS